MTCNAPPPPTCRGFDAAAAEDPIDEETIIGWLADMAALRADSMCDPSPSDRVD